MNQSRLEANHHVTVAKRGKTCTVRVSHDWFNLTTDWMTDGANYLSQSLSVMMQKFMTFDNQVKSALSPPFRLVSVPFTPFFHAQDFTGWKSINTDFQALNIYRRYKMKKKKRKKIYRRLRVLFSFVFIWTTSTFLICALKCFSLLVALHILVLLNRYKEPFRLVLI